ncbi:restriction endonuclease subunit S [Neisseria sp.]
MNEYVLSSMVEIISGGTPKTDKPEYWNGNIGWLSVADFNNVERFVYDSDKTITSKGLQESNTKLLKKGDVIISARGTVGALAQIGKEMAFNQSCFGLRAKPEYITNDFLFYALKNYIKNFKAKSTGSVFETINISSFDLMKLSVPCLKKQQSIAAVLSALDKKIALNKQINARLEEMAKTLYDYWFVQFDFPDANGKPYKSSGGEMVFDETLKREIPKGWEVKSLGEIALTSSGGTPTSTVQEYYKGGNIPWVNSGELNNNFIVYTDNFITQTGMDNSSAKLVSEKSILLAMYGATAGKTSLISFKTTTNQAICSILPKDMNYRVYIKSYLDNMYLYLVQLSSGSARDNLSQDKIKRLHLVIPESGILEIFSNVTEDFYKKIENNLKQNHHLTQLRDFLLPMLMNGQVSVVE